VGDYQSYIENLAKSGDSMFFQNSGPEHAAVVMTTIFKHSKNHIRIFAGNLNGPVVKNENVALRKAYADELVSFIEERNGTLQILLDEFDKDFLIGELYSRLFLYTFLYSDRVQIKKSKTSHFKPNVKKFHFTVGDNKLFRFEKDTAKHAAFGSFNHPDFSKDLINFFDAKFESTDVEPLLA